MDWSGNNNDIAQAVEAQRCKWDANQSNGRAVYKFDGSNDSFNLPDGCSDAAWTLYVVLKPTTVNNSGNRTIFGGSASGHRQIRINSAHKVEFVQSGVAVQHTSTAALSTSVFQLLTITRNTTSGEIRINGVQDSTFGAFAQLNQMETFAFQGGGIEHFDGLMAEVLLYESKHNSTEVDDTEAWLMTNHGL